MHGVEAEEESTPNIGMDGRRQDKRGDPYAEEIEVGADLYEDTGVLGLCVSPTLVLLKHIHNPMIGDIHKKSCLSTNGA